MPLGLNDRRENDGSTINPFSPDATDDEYIPSPASSSSLSSSNNNNNCVYNFKEPDPLMVRMKEKKATRICPNLNKNLKYQVEISTIGDKKTQLDVDTNHDNNLVNMDTSKFEYDNNLKENSLFDDEKIGIINHYFDKLLPKFISEMKKKQSGENKVSNIYASPFLTTNKFKKTICKFCDSGITSRHFARHLERKHSHERQVKEILSTKPGSKERKKYLMLLRNEGNLDDAIRGKIIPKKRELKNDISEKDYAICIHCKGFYKRLSLSRHVKKCFARNNFENIGSKRPLAESLAFVACQKKYGETLSTLNVKEKIFSKMQGDDITKAAIEDILVVFYGEDLLKKHKMKRSFHHISNKLRECGRFLIEIKKMDSFDDMISVLKPENFDKAVDAIKLLSKYDAISRTFGAPSLALHFRTTLCNLCDLASKLVLRKKISYSGNIEDILKNLERFKSLVESQWSIEIGSIALKDINEKSSTKPKLLPITEDIMKLAKLVDETAEDSYKKLCLSKDINSYRILSETVLVSTILHNRKRVGDVQYLEWKSCKEQLKGETVSQHTELVASLSETEKVLTQNYKKITSIGKGSRAVTVLLPKKIQKYFLTLCKLREENWFPLENIYLFTYPYSMHWIDGCKVIRKYASMCNAKHADLLTSSRLRKHIATVTQLFSLKENEVDQLAKFMGHTIKTHESFYKLPQDVYQIAKVSKILQILEKGNAAKFKNKSLDEIDIDIDTIDELEDENDLTDNISDPNELVKVVTKPVPGTSTSSSSPRASAINTDPGTSTTSTGHRTSKGFRQRWLPLQKKIMRKYFQTEIKHNKALQKEQCEKFIQKYKDDFSGVQWLRVKTFIFNEARLVK